MKLQPLADWLGAPPRLILMDLDGTLVDSAADIALSLNRALAELNLPGIHGDQVRLWIGRGAAKLLALALQHVRPHHANDPQASAVEHTLMTHFMRHYEASVCEASTIYPGVMAFIEAAQVDGVPLVCITNKPYQPARALLDALQLLPAFSLLLGGDSLPHKKPHPAPLQHALAQFDVLPTQAVMVGDSVNDVEAARAAGVPSLAVPYGYNHGEDIRLCQPDRLVHDLSEMVAS